MSTPTAIPLGQRLYHTRRGTIEEGPAARHILTIAALLFLGLFLVVPLCVVFLSAFAEGIPAYLSALADSETRSAIQPKSRRSGG